MAQSQIDLYNLALSACGSRDSVAAVTENTAGARYCQRWYEPVRQQAFRAAHWNSLTAYARLGLLATRGDSTDWTTTDPSPGWLYAYSVPNDMVMARYLTEFQRFVVEPFPSQNVQAINTDVEDAILCYTKDETDPGLWDNGLYIAVAMALAAHIARPLTGKRDRVNDLLMDANRQILEAQVQNANERMNRLDWVPEWIQRRGYAGGISVEPYVVPFGAVFQAPGAPSV